MTDPATAGVAAARHLAAQSAWGDDEPEPRAWSAGRWSLELRGDELAELCFDGRRVLRSVKAVIRDRDWGTVPSQTVAVTSSEHALELELRFSGLGGEFGGMLRAEASGDRLLVTTELRALVPFERNRAGLIVLVPADAAGSALEIGHPDGTSERAGLPLSIAPHQPALDIRSLAWEHGGLRVALGFDGEVFEMEDQRNWTDASFKVYSTPLALPFPVPLAAGTVVSEGLEVRAEPDGTTTPRGTAAGAEATSGAAAVSRQPSSLRSSGLRPSGRLVPAIGTSASTTPDPVTTPARDPAPGILLVELDLAAANWRLALARAVAEAGDAALDLRLIGDDPALIVAAVDEMAPLRPLRIGVFSPVTHLSEPTGWRALTEAVAASGLDSELVGGTRAHFTELNRNHQRLPAELPALAFSSTPEMHASERAQLVESIPIQRITALDAVRIAAGRPVHIGPVSLRARFNAVATAPLPPEPADLAHGYGPAHSAATSDPRQASTALTAWLIASAAAFSVAGVASLSYFEASGPRGMRDLPVAETFAWLRELSGRPLLDPSGELAPGVWLLAAEAPPGIVLLLANLDAAAATVEVEGTAVTLDPLSARRIVLPASPASGPAS